MGNSTRMSVVLFHRYIVIIYYSDEYNFESFGASIVGMVLLENNLRFLIVLIIC